MRLALDTNRYTDLMSGNVEVAAIVEAASEIIVPFAVLGELRAGFISGNRRAVNDQTLDLFLKKSFVSPLYPDQTTAEIYADLFAELRRSGRVIPQNDLWIAAICVQHSLTLYTRDKHFEYLPQVQRV